MQQTQSIMFNNDVVSKFENQAFNKAFSSVQSLKSCPTLCDPMNCSTPGLPVHHQLPEFTQTHVHRVSDAIQPSYPLSSPSPPAPNPSQHQSLLQWVNSSHEVANSYTWLKCLSMHKKRRWLDFRTKRCSFYEEFSLLCSRMWGN